jgi:ribosomal protein S15P/S13E
MHNIIYVLAAALLTAHAVASSPRGETTSELELTFGDVTSSVAPTSSPSSHPTSFDWTSFSEELEKMVEKQKQLNAATAGQFDVVDSYQSSEHKETTSQVDWASFSEELEKMVEKEKQLMDSYQSSEHKETTSQVDWASFTGELDKMVEKEKQLVDFYQSSELEETTSQILTDFSESMIGIFVGFVKDIGLEDVFKDSGMPSKLDAISSSTSAEDFAEILSEIIDEILTIFGLGDLVESDGTLSKLDVAGFGSYASSSSSSPADEHASSENDKTESKSSSEQGPVTKGQEVKGKKETLLSDGKNTKKGGAKKKEASGSTESIVSNLNTSTEESSGGPSATTITRITLGVLATICVVALVVTTLRKRTRSREEILPMSNPPSSSISVNDGDPKSVDDEVVVHRIESVGSRKMDMSFEIPLKDASKKSAPDSMSPSSTQEQHGSLSKMEEETNMSMTSDVLSEMKASTMKKKQQLTQLADQCGFELVLM